MTRFAWYAAPVPSEVAEHELAAAKRFCEFDVRLAACSGANRFIEVFCHSPEQAASAGAVIGIAVLDARQRLKIHENESEQIAARVAQVLAQAVGS